jgi:hypothetical protein
MVYQPDQSVCLLSLHWNCNSVQCEFHRTHIRHLPSAWCHTFTGGNLLAHLQVLIAQLLDACGTYLHIHKWQLLVTTYLQLVVAWYHLLMWSLLGLCRAICYTYYLTSDTWFPLTQYKTIPSCLSVGLIGHNPSDLSIYSTHFLLPVTSECRWT